MCLNLVMFAAASLFSIEILTKSYCLSALYRVYCLFSSLVSWMFENVFVSLVCL